MVVTVHVPLARRIAHVYVRFLIVHAPVARLARAISRRPRVATLPAVLAVCTTRVAPTGTVPVVLATPRRTVIEDRSGGTVVAAAGDAGGVAVGATGAGGGAVGTTAPLAVEAAETPTPLRAVTVNVYAVPAVSPVTVHVVAAVVVQVRPPGDAVTV